MPSVPTQAMTPSTSARRDQRWPAAQMSTATTISTHATS
jgi:hypothetical protein